jgi:hypothetical protein
MKWKLVFMLWVFLVLRASGSEKGGLILSGFDTISIPKQKGFDFVKQTCCTTGVNMAPYPCVDHFLFAMNGFYTKCILQMDVQSGDAYFIKMNKMNLDSIRTAPADSLFSKQPLGQGDSIPVDSLSSRIGNVYLMKTAKDPRSFYDVPFYAKLKILKFIVIDSAQHQIKMVFLWAFNITGEPDLHTSGLDTFHLEPTTANQPSNQLARSVNHSLNNQYVFKVVDDRFVLPQELVGKVKWLTVWDLRGRMVGKIQLSMFNDQFAMSNAIRKTGNGNLLLELPKDLKGRGMFVVKGE